MKNDKKIKKQSPDGYTLTFEFLFFPRIIECYLRCLSTITTDTIITQISFPSSSTSSVTFTNHVVTGNFVFTMPYTLLGTVGTVPPFSTRCYTDKCSYNSV